MHCTAHDGLPAPSQRGQFKECPRRCLKDSAAAPQKKINRGHDPAVDFFTQASQSVPYSDTYIVHFVNYPVQIGLTAPSQGEKFKECDLLYSAAVLLKEIHWSHDPVGCLFARTAQIGPQDCFRPTDSLPRLVQNGFTGFFQKFPAILHEKSRRRFIRSRILRFRFRGTACKISFQQFLIILSTFFCIAQDLVSIMNRPESSCGIQAFVLIGVIFKRQSIKRPPDLRSGGL